MSQKHSFGIEASTALDIGSKQLLKYGGDLAYHYHVLGGAQKFSEGGGIIGVTKEEFDSNVSLVFKAGYYIYSLTNKEQNGQKISGSSIPLRPGISFRYGNWESELLVSAINISVGREELNDSSIEINFSYRTSL